MTRALAVLCALAVSASADAALAEWDGHISTLFDAQASCGDTSSVECEPFLAEAVAVAEVLEEIAKPDEKGTDFIVTLHSMDLGQQKCSQNWFQSLNGLGYCIPHSASSWTALRASIESRRLCALHDSCAIRRHFLHDEAGGLFPQRTTAGSGERA